MKKHRIQPREIVLLGDYPPPQGGNSVHIQRLQDKLQSEEVYCDVIDVRGVGEDICGNHGNVFRVGGFRLLTLFRAVALIRRLNPKLLHVHISAFRNFSWAGLFFNLAVREHTRLAMTIHSGSARQGFARLSGLQKMLVQKALKRYDSIIVVNEDQRLFLEAFGLRRERITVIPAFLRPEMTHEYEDLSSLIAPLKKDGRKLICASGNGVRLYGFDEIIEAVITSPGLSQKCAVVICVYDRMDETYMSEVRSLLSKVPNSLLLTDLDSDQFGYILAHSDVYVRATDRDGDAVAIREANMYGVPVVASTSVDRPEYCHLFALGDRQELARKIVDAISEYSTIDNDKNLSDQNYQQIKSFLHIGI
jgi:glycosyltransferase involved in cell wall biosynthesis